MLKQLLIFSIYYGSYVFAGLLFLIFLRKLLRGRLVGLIFRGAIFGLFVRVRLVEPYRLQVQETMIEVGFESDIVLIADLHLGIYKGEKRLQRIVNKINTLENIDAVLIAGDFVYEPSDTSEEALTDLLRPLGYLKLPVIAVLGNHDVQAPGPHLRSELIQALSNHNVTFLQNDIVELYNTKIVGLGAHMAGEDQTSLLDEFDSSENIIVLTHNPDTASKYHNENADVTLVGHTHCGQIRIPWIQGIYPSIYLSCRRGFRLWFGAEGVYKLYITSGLGEVILPMRFMNPPMIDVIHLR